MGQELRCPKCQRSVEAATLAFSSTLGMFVCPECRAAAPVRLPDAQAASEKPRVPMPPPPSLLAEPIEWPPSPAPAKPASTPTVRQSPPPAPASSTRSPLVMSAALVVLAAVITAVAVLLSRGGAPAAPVDPQRAWDQAHHAEIVALKSQAETLAIDGKLKEAHAKYREIEKIIGGRQVKEPTLFDMVEVARQDQDKIYKLMLSQMEKQQRAFAVTRPAQSALPQPVVPAPRAVVTPSPELVTPPPATIAAKPESATIESEPSPPATAPAVAERSITDPSIPEQQFPGVPRGPVSDQQIGDAITRGVAFLLTHFEDGEFRFQESGPESLRQGIDALCVFALASSGKAIFEPRLNPKSPEMNAMLEKLKSYRFVRDGEPQSPLVYSRAMRACALAAFSRPQDRAVLEDDVDWLVNASVEGAYWYDDSFSQPYKPRQRKAPSTRPRARAAMSDGVIPAPIPPWADIILTDGTFTPRPPAPPTLTPPKVFENALPPRPPYGRRQKANVPWDNSCSQFGLLGVWAGAEVGCEVNSNYWRLVQRHWTDCQLPSGEWFYSPEDEQAKFSMTVAGICSLLITHDYLEAPLLGGRANNGRRPYSIALSAGLSWLEDNNNCMQFDNLVHNNDYVGYNLFTLERVGLASGFKHFGAHDWFVELATKALATQFANGALGSRDNGPDAVVDTAFILLFLARGRHPIIANKLRYDGDWSNRPRDLANLSGYASRELERPINWQVVDIVREPADWADAPILFISGNQDVRLNEQQLSKIGEFIDNGGILFTHADLAAEAFNHFATQLSKQLFPRYGPLKDLPADHPIFKLNYTLNERRPRLMGVSNGVRLLMIHSPADLTNAWQVRATLSRKEAFQLGANLYLYATGKEKFRNRLDTPIVPWPQIPPIRELPLARLKYDGNWDPEPGAWPRFGRKLHWESGTALEIKPLPIAELSYDKIHLAHLTGTDAFAPKAEETAALKRFVESGGTLLIDAAGGSSAFADGETAWLPQVLGDAKLQTVTDKDPLLLDTPAKALRLYAMERLANDTSQRLKVARVGKGRVIFTPMDVTSGLLGTNTWGVLGYVPEYSEALVRNVVKTTP